ncbi:MAG: DUF1580 domain-containing protein [Pirellulaceae bacterium]
MSAKNIDLENDELLTLAQACHLLPRRPSPATLWRWRTKGVAVKGQRIRLECVRAGGTWCTTKQAFADFLRRQTDAADPAEPKPSTRSESTERRLAEAGLL